MPNLPAGLGPVPLSARVALAFGVSLGAALLAGPYVVRSLRRLKLGDSGEKGDSEELDDRHRGKLGTPTMGGVLIVAALVLGVLAGARLDAFATRLFLGAVGLLAAIGFIDDHAKLTTRGRGMRSRTKLALLATAGLGIGVAVYGDRVASEMRAEAATLGEEAGPALAGGGAAASPAPSAASASGGTSAPRGTSPSGASGASGAHGAPLGHAQVAASPAAPPLSPRGGELAVPFVRGARIPLGMGYVLFAAFLVLATTNAVNFTDGLDGLCAGTAAIAVATFSLIALIVADASHAAHLGLAYLPDAAEVAVLGAATLGAALGFLWQNAHPARVFMGDTGSLALGGAVALLALLTRRELWLLLAGFVFVLEGLSVALQIGWFKLTGGKRLFRIAPIHHHYQFLGHHEAQVTTRLWILGAIFGALALAALGGG